MATGSEPVKAQGGAGKARAAAKPKAGKDKLIVAAPKYDLSTSAGKKAYLRAEITAMQNGFRIDYAKYKGKPGYKEFAEHVNSEIRLLERMLIDVDNPNATVTITDGRTPNPVKAARAQLSVLAADMQAKDFLATTDLQMDQFKADIDRQIEEFKK